MCGGPCFDALGPRAASAEADASTSNLGAVKKRMNEKQNGSSVKL